ncbi:MAG: hypothetical protein R3Y67_09915 [Eubacteriales bacterium]
MIIKEVLKKSKLLVNLYECLARLFERDEMCEQQKIYGLRNCTKKFYVIRAKREKRGLMGIHDFVLCHILYALDHGYIPVVDAKNYPNIYHEDGELGVVNIWEYYFKQPMEYGLEDAYKSWYVILSRPRRQVIPDKYYDMSSHEDIKQYYEVISHHMQLNDKTQQEVDKEEQALRIFAKDGKIIGVCCRGTDYTSLKPTKHSIPYTAEQTIQLVKEKLKEWDGYKYVYLATEDEEILDKFIEEFGTDKILYYVDCKRFPSDTENRTLDEIDFDRENDKYLKGLEYLKTIYLLAKCDSAILPDIGGTLAAVRINGNKYEHTILIDNGRYE